MIRKAKRRREQGQTIILVAISVVALLAMAALAIDVVTLYVASSEIKRAADAVALAAAKAIADSGVTTLQQTDPNFPAAQTLAINMVGTAATGAIGATLPANTVAGAAPTLVSVDWSQAWTNPGNPIITVSLRRTGLPTFFAKIWGRAGSTVSASSTAEAYNPSNNSPYTPIAPIVVKPWLVANADPLQVGNFFIAAGNLAESGAIGETFDLTPDCGTLPPFCVPPSAPTVGTSGIGHWVQYVPACVVGQPCHIGSGSSANVCPSCMGATNFEQSIECADVATTYSCGPGGASLDASVFPGGANGPSALGAECLTQAGGAGPDPPQSQDILSYAFPSSPPEITAGTYSPYSGSLVSTSGSIVTIPIVDPNSVITPPINVVGFLQAFINGVEPGMPNGTPTAGDINITLLNIAGCNGTSNSNPPVVGGRGTSPVAVRLIAPPTS